MRHATKERIDVIVEGIAFSGMLLVGIVASSLMLAETSHYQALKIGSALIIAGLAGGVIGYLMGKDSPNNH